MSTLSMSWGEDKSWTVSITDINPTTGLVEATDITGWTLWFAIRLFLTDAVPLWQAKTGSGIVISAQTGATKGQAVVTMPRATLTTALLPSSLYRLNFAWRALDGSGNESVPDSGILNVYPTAAQTLA